MSSSSSSSSTVPASAPRADAALLPSWPPQLSPAQIAALAAEATDYALAHGIVYRPAAASPPSTHVHHAPISLLPSPFPRAAFRTAIDLQSTLNELYARVALDDAFLERVIGGNVAQVDEFQRGLWEVYKQVRDEGNEPTYHLGIFRSDYLMHTDTTDPSASLGIRQVEFNTISSSFGPLCAKVGELHRALLAQTDYHGAVPDILKRENLPKNTALQLLADGLAQAHKTYLQEHPPKSGEPEPRILFVVQDKERNAFDQRWLEYELLERHGIRSIRRTFSSLISTATLSDTRELSLNHVNGNDTGGGVSIIYYRSGYTPTDFTSAAHWDLRLRLERSTAIKCPTVALQLAGAKKVQQVLAEPGVVERFLLETRYPREVITALRQTWAGLYPLDEGSALGREGLRLAQEESNRFVMKPQREGGGNNIYRADIPKALAEMEKRDAQRAQSQSQSRGASAHAPAQQPKEREGFILMELIQPPKGIGNYLIRPPAPGAKATPTEADATVTLPPHAEGLTTAECRLSPDVISELGIYGVALFRRRGAGGQAELDEEAYYSTPAATEEAPREAAYLLRTKGSESDEGGVAVGFSVLDSVVLV